MRQLDKFISTATPSTAVQFRERPYGRGNEDELLRDVLAIANADVDGSRLIITGVGIDANGEREFGGVGDDASRIAATHKKLIREYIEPPIRIDYQAVRVDDIPVGVYTIADCQDKPYMVRIDHSDTLQRGDAWLRSGNRKLKLGRSQLQCLFAARFRDSVSPDKIEVGFGADIVQKVLIVPTIDLEQLPSRRAAGEIGRLINARKDSKGSGMTTRMERLMHMRVRGAEVPFEPRSTVSLEEEILAMPNRHRENDHEYLFNANGCDVPLVVLNHGEDAIQGASIVFELPIIDGLHLATELPDSLPPDNPFRGANIMGRNYPSVQIRDDVARVSKPLGEIPAGAVMLVSEAPVRIACGAEAAGRRLAIRYTLSARNLRTPAQGRLKLCFDHPGKRTAIAS